VQVAVVVVVVLSRSCCHYSPRVCHCVCVSVCPSHPHHPHPLHMFVSLLLLYLVLVFVCGLLSAPLFAHTLVMGNVLVCMQAAPPLSDCPCSDPSYCAALRVPARPEVFAFQVSLDNWRHYDYTQLTTIAMFGGYDVDMLCFAHERNVRVVFATNYPVDMLGNVTNQNLWISTLVQRAISTYTDGVNVDIEVCVWVCPV